MKIKYSALVSEMRGKLNGSVASRNRGGAYLRNKVTPVNPRTTYQQTVRARITNFAQAWKGLTQGQRDSFNAAVALFAKTDIFGDLKNPSGFNLYVRLNTNLANAGQAAITAPPTSLAVASVTLQTVAIAAGAATITNTFSGAIPANTTAIFRATPGLSAGKSFVTNLLRQFFTRPPGTASPMQSGTPYIAKFGAIPAAGQVVHTEVYFINNLTGVTSARQRVVSVVAA